MVEDDRPIAQAIKKGLEQEAFAVDLAHDGEAGFDLAASEEYDAIVLDLMLPKMDGVTLCRKLRREENAQTPILMLTARGQLDDKVAGLNAGADDYLPKPFAFEELLARIRALVRRPRAGLTPVLQIGDLNLNTLTLEVKRGRQAIDLTKKEFALLEYLLRNKGKVLSKEQIIAHVWDYQADILPNTVEVYIGYLRKKLARPGAKKKFAIKTVRGFGYRIEEA